MRGVVDELEDVFIGQAVGGGADRRICELPREGELGCVLAEQPAHGEHRRRGEEFPDDLELGRGEVVPSTRGCDAGQRARSAAALQLEGHPAAERVADDVGRAPAECVHPALDVVGQRRGVEEELSTCTAVVAGHRRRKDLVVARVSYQGCDAFPHVLRQDERVQQQHRFAGAEVNGIALLHAADIKGDTAGTASSQHPSPSPSVRPLR